MLRNPEQSSKVSVLVGLQLAPAGQLQKLKVGFARLLPHELHTTRAIQMNRLDITELAHVFE